MTQTELTRTLNQLTDLYFDQARAARTERQRRQVEDKMTDAWQWYTIRSAQVAQGDARDERRTANG